MVCHNITTFTNVLGETGPNSSYHAKECTTDHCVGAELHPLLVTLSRLAGATAVDLLHLTLSFRC
jgi:hypothetical protein